jgi:SAM-dependent methyltransferase
MDCMVSIQVLCSVPNPPESVQQIWRLLKPGGTFIFEHVASQDWLTRLVQSTWPFSSARDLPSSTDIPSIEFWNWIWPFAIGGCQLDRQTIDRLLRNGDWEVLELERDAEAWTMLPRVWGRLRKVARGQGIKTV